MFVAHLVKDLGFQEKEITEIHYVDPDIDISRIPYKKVVEE